MGEHKRRAVAAWLAIVMGAGGMGQGCATTSRVVRVDASAPTYVMPMAQELGQSGISTIWDKPTDAGLTRQMSRPYQVIPTTCPSSWTAREIVHPGRGGYTGLFNETGWAVANDKNDWADSMGSTWKRGHSHLNLYRVQDGTMTQVTSLDATQPGSELAYNMSYVLTDHFVVWLAFDQPTALYNGNAAGSWTVAAYDLDAGRQMIVLGADHVLWGVRDPAGGAPRLCTIRDGTCGIVFGSKDLVSGKLFSNLVLLDLDGHANRMLASSPVGTLWGTPVMAHGAIYIDQIQWPREKPGEQGRTYRITSIDVTSGTVAPLFSSPLSLRSGLNDTLVLIHDPPEMMDANGASAATWQGTTDVWTYDCVEKQLVCLFGVPGSDLTGTCAAATAMNAGLAYAATQTILQAYFYSYATGSIFYTGNVVGDVFPPGNYLVLDKDQRAAFGGISDKDVSGNLLLVEPE